MADGIRFSSAGPLSVLAIILLIGLVILLIPLLILGVIGVAFTRLGLSWITALALVLLMLAGSFVNIPVYRIRRDMIRAIPAGYRRGMNWSLLFRPRPVWETVISVNLGGGILPVCIAIYLMYQAVLVTGTASSRSGCPVCSPCHDNHLPLHPRGSRCRDPCPVHHTRPHRPPCRCSLLGGTGLTAAVTALAGGMLGTIAGGNLAHLFRVRDLEVPEVSIGGFGTFGAVFLCCILPALIA